MKSYLIVFFVLLSFVGFGQNNESNCLLDLNPVNGLFESVQYNHFEELFPNEKMKKNGIKSFIIVINDDNNNEIPTIHVQNKNLYKYVLNDKGFVIQHEEMNFQKFYERNRKGQILKETSILNRNDTTTSIYHYFPERLSVLVYGNYSDVSKPTVSDYFYDDKNRFYGTQNRYYNELKMNFSSYPICHLKYDDKNHFSINLLDKTDTVFYNNQWKPIKYVTTLAKEKIIQSITYKNGLIATYQGKEVTGYGVSWEDNYSDSGSDFGDFDSDFGTEFDGDNNDNDSDDDVEISNKVKIIPIIPLKNVEFETEIKESISTIESIETQNVRIQFHYNTNGLLEKITNITDENTCEYRVYYYTK